MVYDNLPEGVPSDANAGVRFHVGVYRQFKITNTISFVPEIQLSRKGANSTDLKIYLDYLEVPLVVAYAPVKWLDLEVGPDICYNVYESERRGGSTQRLKGNLFKNLDFGITAGLKFRLTDQVAVVGRYYFAITPTADIKWRDENNLPSGSTNIYNRNIQLGVAWQFKKTEK
jgi:hypothetical protein